MLVALVKSCAWHFSHRTDVFILSQPHFWKHHGFSPAGLCWEMPEQLWHSWRYVVSSLIARNTWWGINSTPLKIILCVNGWEELKSHSSLVLPEGTSFPLHVAKSFCVQNFSEISFSCCTQPPSFCWADRHIASDRCKSSLSSPWVPPSWFLWEVFAVWPALGTFFLLVVPCFWGSCAAQCSWAKIAVCMILCSCIPHRGCRSTVLPWIMESSWKPD